MEFLKTVACFVGLLCLSELGILVSIILWYMIREFFKREKSERG